MTIAFSKYHGAGNDFILLDGSDPEFANYSDSDFQALAIRMCHRHFGVGADGLMVARTGASDRQDCDARMLFLNGDGSRASMCGNGLRCFARFICDRGLAVACGDKETADATPMMLRILTDAGVYRVQVQQAGHADAKADAKADGSAIVVVEMGAPRWDQPALGTGVHHFQQQGQDYEITVVEMGVPHGVTFVQDLSRVDVCSVGAWLEKQPAFPQGINVNFVQIDTAQHMTVHTWERGAGFTLACGTGVCASYGVARRLGLCREIAQVTVPGGTLSLSTDAQGGIVMAGGAVLIARGVFFG